MDLFEMNYEEERRSIQPLSERFRPLTLDDIAGQQHLLGKGKLLRSLIEQDRVTSMILQGPPSSGKTTIATVISLLTKAHFVKLNAVSLTVAELRNVFARALDEQKLYGQNTIVFIDEIHAMKSNVQEALLPVVENGTIVLMGATTESIAHDIIPPLASRCRIYRLETLSENDIKKVITKALADEERGLGKLKVKLEPEALDYVADICNGDIRNALNALENAVYSLTESDTVTLATVQEVYQFRTNAVTTSDVYNLTSAFCKSIRGSHSDAAVYWLARLLESGVDPIYIVRRMVVHASEDIGMANPHALQIALAAKDAVQFVGMPEARIPLAQAVIYLCESPKSNSAYKAIAKALDTVRSTRAYPVPDNIKDGSKSYINPIDNPGSRVQYMPEELQGLELYKPQNSGVEAKIYAKRQPSQR
ncbi:replication-associated recombination protein A [Paenibacillus sp. YYML68]|uniref:replication-associated recombination protein A n=1 Tax=Paenibacillus sp. YYML68 TaxID=2909250 RepID=UPI002491B333|nr:replication-associated recombination protein A [Paenibacillus sp. YYML68]